MEQAHGGIIAWVSARVIAAPALAMPYGLRMRYIRAIAFLVHVPFRAFGRIARYLLQKLDIALTPPRGGGIGSAARRAGERAQEGGGRRRAVFRRD